MESFQTHSAPDNRTENINPPDVEAGLATDPTVALIVVGSAPNPDSASPGDERHTAIKQSSSPPQPYSKIHSRAESAAPTTDSNAIRPSTPPRLSSTGENLGQDDRDKAPSEKEADSSNAKVKKEELSTQGVPNAHHEPTKKVLYIPVSDNIGEVDARRLFNLLSQFESVKSSSGKSYNYEEKYPEDAPGQELGEDARVFKVYNDLAEEYDRDMIRGFRDTLDSLLIFASLFSAVITTFVVQTAQALPTDQAVITNHLLVDIATLLRANGNITVLATIPPSNFGPDTSTFKTTDIWINGLFFASLSLALATALLSVLAKQWLQAYTTVISGPAKEIALIRHLRFRGLEKWKMHEIIGALPLILHASLALFFAGLFIFVRTLYEGIAFVVIIIGGLAFLCYLGSIILPAIDLQCPYRVTLLYPASKYVVYAAQCLYTVLRRMSRSIARAVAPQYFDKTSLLRDAWPIQPGSLQKGEVDAVSGDVLTADCLVWLRDLSSNITIRRIVAWTAAAEKECDPLHAPKEIHSDIIKHVFDLPTASLLFQSAFDADDSEHVVSTQKSYWPSGWPIVEYEFPSAVDGINNAQKLPLRALRSFVSYGNHLDPIPWISLVHDYIKSTAHTNHPAVLNTLLNFVSDDLQIARAVALVKASGRGHIDVVRLSLERGVDVNFPVNSGDFGSALASASCFGRLEVAKLLVEKGADVNLHLSSGDFGSALDAAVCLSRLEMVNFLLENGANVNLCLSSGESGSALARAASQGDLELVKLLVEKGAHANLLLSSGEFGSALAAAARQGELEVVQLLVDKGADVNLLLSSGNYSSGLAAARAGRHVDVSEFLIAKGAMETDTR